MADFKTALEALATGELELEALTQQLSKLLSDNPKYATRLLAQLEAVNETGRLNNQSYTELKRQINEFRRAHSSETESVDNPADPESTVFAQDGNEDADSEDATEIKENSDSEMVTDLNAIHAVDSEDSTEINLNTDVDSEDSTEVKARNVIDSEDSTEINERARGGTAESTQV
jgi:hypothetical protein